MNKLIFVTLIAACVCRAAVALDAADEDKEVGLLLGHETLFAPYCLSERTDIVQDIKNRVADQSSVVFGLFFGAATEIADEVLSVEKQAAEEFAKQIENPSEKVSDEPLSEDKIQHLVEEGKREIQDKSGPLGRLMAATKNMVGQVFYHTANSAIFVRLAKARSYMKADTLLRGIVQTCAQVSEYEKKLEEDLVVAKSQLAEENQDNAEVKKFIESMTVANLKCYTTKYISRLDGFCRLIQSGAGPFLKMLGVSATFEMPSASEPVFKSS